MLLPFAYVNAANGNNEQVAINEMALMLQLSGDEELISLATGTPRPVSKAPSVATVITREEIENSGALSVAQLLERVPGLHMGISAANRIKPLYSLRGVHTDNSAQILILFNGHAIPDLYSGSVQPNLYMPLNNIERVEIIRGPGSAVHGADAFAGVVNIVSRTPDDLSGMLTGAKVGSFNTQNAWAHYGGELAGWKLLLSSEYSKSDGDRDRLINSDLQTNFDTLFATSASSAPAALDTRYESIVNHLQAVNNNWAIAFNSWNQKDVGVGPGIANALDPEGNDAVDQYLLYASYEDSNWIEHWSFKADASYYFSDLDSHFVIFPAGSVLPIGADGNLDFVTPAGFVTFTDGMIGNPRTISEAAQVDVSSNYSGWADQRWRFNLGVRREQVHAESTANFGPGVIDGTEGTVDGTLTDTTGTDGIFIPNVHRTVQYLSLQDEWGFQPDWLLTAGVRIDHYSDFGTTTNPRLSLLWDTRHDLTTKLLYGRSFRAPTLAELNQQNNPVVLGNPNLNPETIDTYELAFDYRHTNGFTATLNLFHYEIDGLIEYVDDDGNPGGTATAQNNKDTRAEGFELAAYWPVSKEMNINGSFAHQNARDRRTGDKVANAPRHLLNLGINWRFLPQWQSSLEAYRVMDRPRASGDTRGQVKDYTWVNLNVRTKKVFNNWDFSFSVRNLLDEDAREPGPTSIPDDYPLEGRSAYLSAILSL